MQSLPSGHPQKQQIITMFNKISSRYDLLNHLLSFSLDYFWRQKALKFLACHRHTTILDVATGTGDLAFLAAKKFKPSKVIGVDIAEGMLAQARKKCRRKHLPVSFQYGDAEYLSFHDGQFSTVMAAFGIRNFENLVQGLQEMFRVLQPGGQLMLMEFAVPRPGIFQKIFQFYFQKILPSVGKKISKHALAYQYLFTSVQEFLSPVLLKSLLQQSGFKNIRLIPLTGGVVMVYLAER